MTIQSAVRTAGPFYGTGVIVAYPFYFKVFATTDVLAVKTVVATGAQTTLAEGGDYTVALNADQDASPGGTVTLAVALALGSSIELSSDIEATQGAVISNQGGFLPKVIEAALDRAVVLIQQLTSRIGRGLRVPEFSGVSEFPTIDVRKNKLVSFGPDGNVAVVAPSEGTATALSLDLISPSGSSLISFIQAGLGAVARTLQARGREVIRSSDFSGDAYTRIAAAIAEAKTRVSPHLVIEPGLLDIGDNTLSFDVPNGTHIDFIGTITTTAAAKTAVRIGTASAHTYWLTWVGLKLQRASSDYSGSSVGVELLNLAWCEGSIRKCTGFRIGVMPHGNGFGHTYNKVSLGQIHDNRDNFLIRVTNPAGGGYCNECLWLDGSFNHTTGYDVATYNGRNLVIEYNATNQPNNHIFLGPSLEDAHASSANTVAAEISGANNIIVHPRVERIFSPTNYQIKFTANATECGIAGDGFSLLNSNVDDLGANTKYVTREGQFLSYQTPSGTGKGAFTVMSTTSSSARILRVLDASKVERAYLNGEGLVYARNLSLDNLGAYADEAAAIVAGVPLHGLYFNTTSGSVSQRRTP